MKKIKLILFDVDQTLIYGNEAALYYKQYPKLLEQTISTLRGVTMGEAKNIADEYRQQYNGRGEVALESLSKGNTVWHDALCSLETDPFIQKMSHVHNLLNTLKFKGYSLGVITDGPTSQAKKLLSSAQVATQLFSIFIGWERGKKMPKGGTSDVYKKIIEQTKLQPSEILMVGDSLETDILPAHACNMNVLHIHPTSNTNYPTIPSIETLTTYLKNHEK